MLDVQVLTLMPSMFEALTQYGVSGRAVEKGLLGVHCVNPRDYAEDRHRTVDDKPYGGGPGMVMAVRPLKAALSAAQARFDSQAPVIYLSPQGRKLQQSDVARFSGFDRMILLCGRYEGIDERFVEAYVDEEISIGDYVLSGGELPAMVLLDAMIRLLPGALGSEESAAQDSFSTANLLDHPHYTRPENVDGMAVPEVLLSGDHAKIAEWREQQSLKRTLERRPDLIEESELTTRQLILLKGIDASNKTST